MRLAESRLIPVSGAGSGHVARFGGVVAVIGPDPARVASAALLELVRAAADAAGTVAIERAAGLVQRAAGRSLPAFALLCEDGDVVRIGMYGSVGVTVGQPAGSRTLREARPSADADWEEVELRDVAFCSMRVGSRALGAVPGLVVLGEGVVNADAAVLLAQGVAPADIDPGLLDGTSTGEAEPAEGEPAEGEPAEPAPAEAAPAEPAPAEPPAPPEPRNPEILLGPAEPVAAPPQAVPPAEHAPPAPDGSQTVAVQVSSVVARSVQGASRRVQVHGVRCARGHFNDPRARYCAVCGHGMVQVSVVLVEGERPPLGVLVFSSGVSHPLDSDLVVGRDPAHDERVRAGEAVALELASESLRLSRVHAELRLQGWDVALVDRGSLNGTHIWQPQTQQWQRLAPDTPHVLDPGAEMAFGDVTARFESGLNQ